MTVFEQTIAVRWADLDPNGHVRHSVYYDYGAQARIAYLQQHGVGIDWMARHGFGPVLFREEAHFYRELKSGDALVIDTALAGLSADHRKWSMRHTIRRGAELCAVLDLDGAWLDLRTRRIVAPPPELRERFEALPRSDDFRILVAGGAAARP